MSDKVAVIKSSDMPEDMQQEVIKITEDAIRTSEADGDVASKIKSKMDDKYGETWHCTVGSSFGSKVTHIEKTFIFFYLGTKAYQLYRFG